MMRYAQAFIDEPNLVDWRIAEAIGQTVARVVGTFPHLENIQSGMVTIRTEFVRNPDYIPYPGLLVRSIWEEARDR